MRLGFSEFSYGYAFTENLIRWSGNQPNTAPKFPNLVEEGDIGYDLRIDLPGQPLFFQFKMPELMKRRTAREIAHLGLSGLPVPFFRMPLMRRDVSNQHELLIVLEGRYPERVFYASTLSENVEAFNEAYRREAVHSYSAFFLPSNIDLLPDDIQHSVSYRATFSRVSPQTETSATPTGCPTRVNPANPSWPTIQSIIAWRCSEPKRLEALRFSDLQSRIEKFLDDKGQPPLRDTIRIVKDSILDLLPDLFREAEGEVREAIHQRVTARLERADKDSVKIITEILVTRELARVGLGVEMMISQPRKPEKNTA